MSAYNLACKYFNPTHLQFYTCEISPQSMIPFRLLTEKLNSFSSALNKSPIFISFCIWAAIRLILVQTRNSFILPKNM